MNSRRMQKAREVGGKIYRIIKSARSRFRLFSAERQANAQAIKARLWRQFGPKRISVNSPEFEAAISAAQAKGRAEGRPQPSPRLPMPKVVK